MQLKSALASLCSLALITTLAACTHPAPQSSATLPAASQPNPANSPADQPATRKDKNGKPDLDWLKTHDAYVAQAQKGNIGLYFIGDANTQRWTTTGKSVWTAQFHFYNPADFGIAGDTTQQILWRLQNGELPAQPPGMIILSAGANNFGSNTPEQTAASLAAITKLLREKCPDAHILLLAILPRNNPDDPQRKFDDAVNIELAKLKDAKHITFLNPSHRFLLSNKALNKKLFENDTYLTEAGYQGLASALNTPIKEWLEK